MINTEELKKYKEVQSIAKKTINQLSNIIKSGMSEQEVSEKAKDIMINLGVTGFWYYGIPAMVLARENTKLFSRDDYINKKNKILKENDILWIDLAPEIDGFWGDCTRTFVLYNGKVVKRTDYEQFKNNKVIGKFVRLVLDIETIQKNIISNIFPEMTFHDLWKLTLSKIKEAGYTSQDERNFGHTIVRVIKDRRFIEKDDNTVLRDKLFALEFQIGIKGLDFGARIEDVFYFDKNKRLTKL